MSALAPARRESAGDGSDTDGMCLSVGNDPFAQVRVASTFLARFVGLLNRSSLDGDEGLLFVPGGSIHTLWMRFPIDVIFLDEQWTILRVATSVRPWRFLRAPRGTRFVLELAAGAARVAALDNGVMLQRCRLQPTRTRASDRSSQPNAR
jgi:uncharacterized protein